MNSTSNMFVSTNKEDTVKRTIAINIIAAMNKEITTQEEKFGHNPKVRYQIDATNIVAGKNNNGAVNIDKEYIDDLNLILKSSNFYLVRERRCDFCHIWCKQLHLANASSFNSIK